MIEVKNATKIFHENSPEEFCAFRNISLHVKKKEIFLINGVSGSGKSTLLALIAGLYKPTYGEIIVGGESISKMPESFSSRFRREQVGIIFQNFNLIPTLSALENTLLPTLPQNKNFSKKALSLLEEFGVADKRDVLVKNLSGGEQQRVAIARALINSPSLILADEPTANLDKELSRKLLEFLELMQKKGLTIVISTHDELLLNWKLVNTSYKLDKQEL